MGLKSFQQKSPSGSLAFERLIRLVSDFSCFWTWALTPIPYIPRRRTCFTCCMFHMTSVCPFYMPGFGAEPYGLLPKVPGGREAARHGALVVGAFAVGEPKKAGKWCIHPSEGLVCQGPQKWFPKTELGWDLELHQGVAKESHALPGSQERPGGSAPKIK